MRYRCYNCGGEFYLDANDYVRIPGNAELSSNDFYRERVVKDKTDAAVDLLISPVRALFFAFTRKGRASRAEFLGSTIFVSLMFYNFLNAAYSEKPSQVFLLSLGFLLYSILSFYTCMERRAHDCEREEEIAKFFAWGVISFVVAFFLFPVAMVVFLKTIIVLLVTPGVPFRNQYGDPA